MILTVDIGPAGYQLFRHLRPTSIATRIPGAADDAARAVAGAVPGRAAKAANLTDRTASLNVQVRNGLGRRDVLDSSGNVIYNGSNATPASLANDLYGTTKTSTEIATNIRKGNILVSIVGDELFEKAYLWRGGNPAFVKETFGFTYGARVYLRSGSKSFLLDAVHEGKHALDFLAGFRGTVPQWEMRAWAAEREYAVRLGLPLPHRSMREMMWHIRFGYGQ